MGVGSAFTGGYNAAKAAQQQRSYMPMINTLGQMIRDARARIPRTTTRIAFNSGPSSAEMRSQEIQRRHDLEKLQEEEKYRYEMERQRQEELDAQKQQAQQAEEARRQEAHDVAIQQKKQAGEIQQQKAGQEQKTVQRQEAYQQAVQGLMMGDSQLVEDALLKMMPDKSGPEQDVVSFGTTKEGYRSVKARPQTRQVPKFIFHPDGYVGVVFPGKDKPVVFKDAQEAFTRIIAPMNPQRLTQKPGTAKDLVAEEKNLMEADYKRKKLQAEIHKDAHEAAMKQFEADGYYQPALYDDKKYWKAYNDYVQRATGEPPKTAQGQPKQGRAATSGKPKQYRGEQPPEGFPNARRGPRGGWYIQKKGKWYPILEGQEQSPAAPPKQARPPGKKRKPKRSPLPTAKAEAMQAAGVSFHGTKDEKKSDNLNFNPKTERWEEKKIYRGKTPPPDYPDAQYDEKEGVWYYFDGPSETWKKVRV